MEMETEEFHFIKKSLWHKWLIFLENVLQKSHATIFFFKIEKHQSRYYPVKNFSKYPHIDKINIEKYI